MKTFLLILAVCTTPDTEPFTCIPSPDGAATVYTYERLVDCVRAERWIENQFAAEAYCATDEVSPAEYLKG